MLQEDSLLKIKVKLKFSKVLAAISRVLEKAVQVNGKLLTIISILLYALSKAVMDYVDIACSNVYKSIEGILPSPSVPVVSIWFCSHLDHRFLKSVTVSKGYHNL